MLLGLGEVLQLIGRWSEAESTYSQALALAEQAGALLLQARCQRAIGALTRARGLYTEAWAWLERARASFDLLDDQQGVADTLREIGIVYWSQGDYPGALGCFEQCLEIAQGLGDQHSIKTLMNNMGLVYWTQGDRERALDSFEQCYQIASELGDRLAVSISVGNMGNVYLDQGDYAQALECYGQNLQIALQLGDRLGVSISVGNMGDVYLDQGDYVHALACYGQNLHIALDLGDQSGISLVLWNMARAHMAQDRDDLATGMLGAAIALGRALDTPYELCYYLFTQVELLLRQRQYQQALQANNEVLHVSTYVERREVQLKALIMGLQLTLALQQMQKAAALRVLGEMLVVWPEPADQAALHYARWHLDQSFQDSRSSAAALYQNLYGQTPKVEYRHRYEDLTGDQLPAPPSLPPLPDLVSHHVLDIDGLLDQVEGLLGELAAA